MIIRTSRDILLMLTSNLTQFSLLHRVIVFMYGIFITNCDVPTNHTTVCGSVHVRDIICCMYVCDPEEVPYLSLKYVCSISLHPITIIVFLTVYLGFRVWVRMDTKINSQCPDAFRASKYQKLPVWR